MKYRSLALIASCTKVLAWVVMVLGIVSSIRLGIIASTLTASVAFLLGGFLVTAIVTLLLLAAAKLMNLSIDIQKDVSEIAASMKKEPKE